MTLGIIINISSITIGAIIAVIIYRLSNKDIKKVLDAQKLIKQKIDIIASKDDKIYSLLIKFSQNKLATNEEANELKAELEKKAEETTDWNKVAILAIILVGLAVFIYLINKKKSLN